MSDKESDPRLNHMKYCTLQLLNLDIGLWEELVWKEDNVVTLRDFLDTPSSTLLCIFLDHNKKLSLSQEIPSPKDIPHVMAYFMKDNIVTSSEHFKREIMCGNICNSPLIQYQKIFEKVLYPIFSNPRNNSRWPKEIAQDIIYHIENFRKCLTYHVGIAEGRTILIIPEMAKNIESFDVNEISSDSTNWKLHEMLNSITDMLCNWIPVVKEVIELTSEEILLKVQQGPATEIQFWNERKINLEFILKQLNDACISKMIIALEKSDSCHFSLFKSLLQNVAEALDEATEISHSLTQMSSQLQSLETCEFPKLIEELPDAMKAITLSWKNSKYFSTVPSRISVLIQKTCYFLIEKIQMFLNPSELFKSKQTEMMENVKVSLETCNAFLKSYSECQEKHDQDIKNYPWEFPDKRVFSHFENFLDKLNKIYQIFEAYEVYCSIPEYKIAGIQQVPFMLRLNALSATFKENYQVFIQSTYNPLDLKSSAFLEDYNMFSLKMDELDYKLGTTLAQACISSVTSEDCFKLINLVQNLLKRPLVNREFKKLTTSLLNNIYMELVTAKESYYNMMIICGSDNVLTYKNLPAAAGIMQWSIDLQRKLSYPVDSLQKIEDYFINADDAELILQAYKEMNELLSNFQHQIFRQWNEILNTITKNLEEPLFIINDKNHLLLNFTHQIMDITNEMNYIKMIKKEALLPSDALKLDETLNKILLAYSLLSCTIRWYNELIDNLMEYEKALLKDEWEKVCKDLNEGLEKKWIDNNLPEYSENIYMATKSIFERVNQAMESVREVQQFIEIWNKSPVLIREATDSLVKFEMFMTARMRQQAYHVIETAINMCRVMEQNLLIFECDPDSEEWKSYVCYLESIIEHGLIDSIKCSLEYLAENTDAENKKLAPFYKINMILKEDITFTPSLNESQQGSLFKLFEAAIEKIYSPAMEIRRMTDTNEHYLEEIKNNPKLNTLKNKIFQHLELATNKVFILLTKYQTYADIWLQNIDDVLEDFVLYGPLPEKSEEEEEMTELDVSLEIKPPSEEEFRIQITQFDALLKKVEDLPSEMLVESWLLLDIISFKDTLSSLIRNWASAYKRKLIEMKSQGKLRKLEDDSDL